MNKFVNKKKLNLFYANYIVKHIVKHSDDIMGNSIPTDILSLVGTVYLTEFDYLHAKLACRQFHKVPVNKEMLVVGILYSGKTDHKKILTEGYIKEIIIRNYQSILKWVSSIAPRSITLKINLDHCYVAAQYGHLWILKWALENVITSSLEINRLANIASSHGQLGVLQWLYHTKQAKLETNCMHAAMSGNLPTLKWTYEMGSNLHVIAVNMAASYGYIHMLEWIRSNKCFEGWYNDEIGFSAASCGQVESLKWLKNNVRYNFTTEMTEIAACHGHINVLEWFHNNNVPITSDIIIAAARSGIFSVVKWLVDKNFPKDVGAAIWAVRNGDLKMLKYLHEVGGIQFNPIQLSQLTNSTAVRNYLISC
jgi:hypothetical protein